MEKINFETLASKYGLTVDFVKELHEKVIDKENFAPVRYGCLWSGCCLMTWQPGKTPSMLQNIGTRSPKICGCSGARKRKTSKLQWNNNSKIVEYYNGCKVLLHWKIKPSKTLLCQGWAFGRLCPFWAETRWYLWRKQRSNAQLPLASARILGTKLWQDE